LRELWLERRYARQRYQTERDRDVILAWQIQKINVMTQNRQRLPSLQDVLAHGKPTTAEAQKAVFYQISARFGVPIVRRPRGEQ